MQNSKSSILTKPDGKVFLNLAGKEYKPTRMIGKISNSVFYPAAKTFRLIYRQTNSLCYNYELLSQHQDKFNGICQRYTDENNNTFYLYTTARAIIKRGRFVNYTKNDLEKQIGYPLPLFKNSLMEALNELREIEQAEKNKQETPNIKPMDYTLNLFSGEAV